MNQSPRTTRHAFTLTELLVTLVVVPLTVAVALPALAQTRTQAQSSVAYANLKRMTDAQIAHAHANAMWLAGPNTTGWDSIVTYGDAIEGDTTCSTPTQTQDWISPTMGEELGLSPNRAERMRQLFDFLADPRSIRHLDQLYADAVAPSDVNDFFDAFSATPFLQVSYLAPSSFHLRPAMSTWTPDPGSSTQPLTGFRDPATVPPGYLPRLDMIGPPATKVCVADGTRYLSATGGLFGTTVLDIEITSVPGYYANFLSATPIQSNSRAYGRSVLPSIYNAENVRLSMRYPDPSSAFGRGMHVAHFDGSVDFISAETAWGQASLWFPSGSVFTGTQATAESKAIYTNGEVLP